MEQVRGWQVMFLLFFLRDGVMNEHVTAVDSKAMDWICLLKRMAAVLRRQLPRGCQHPQQPIVRRAMIDLCLLRRAVFEACSKW